MLGRVSVVPHCCGEPLPDSGQLRGLPRERVSAGPCAADTRGNLSQMIGVRYHTIGELREMPRERVSVEPCAADTGGELRRTYDWGKV